jgi:hypothetical protein
MPRSLADGHERIMILTEEPANWLAPTAAELAAGIYASPHILMSDWTFTTSDSDTVDEPSVEDTNHAPVPTLDNFSAGMTVFREYDEDGDPDPTADALYDATKVKGTTLYIYCRQTGKLATAAAVAGDELRLGMIVITDSPQSPQDPGGYIKRRVPLLPQKGKPDLEVAA